MKNSQFDDKYAKPKSIQDFLKTQLEGSDYNRGAAEAAKAQADNATAALIRLIEILEDKKIIDESDIIYIATGSVSRKISKQ